MAIHKYRVREGFRYGVNNQYVAGTILELDDSVAQHSLDKLELAEIVLTPRKEEPLIETPEAPLPPEDEDTPEEEETPEAVKPPRRRRTTGAD